MVSSGKGDGDRTAALEREVADLRRRLEESQLRMATLLDGTGDGIFMVDPAGRFLFVNDFIARSSGFPAEAFVGRHFHELIREEDRERVQRNFERALAGEQVPAYELAYHTAAGKQMWVELQAAPVVRDGEVTGVLSISRNIQRRKEMEGALREGEEKYRSLVEALPLFVGIVQDSKIVFVNEAAKRVFGLDLAGETPPISHFVTPTERPRTEDLVRRRDVGDPVPDHYRSSAVTAAGDEIPVDVYVQPMTFGGRPALQYVAIDRSEHRNLEEQIRQIQKMEALGTLAGGIAHDFNNLLTAILTTADLLKRGHESGAPGYGYADTIERAARRAASLTQQLLGFARRNPADPRPVEVHGVIEDVCDIFTRTGGSEIEVVQRLEADPAVALGEPGQLEQVLMNLVVNARDAMPEGGELTIATSRVELTDTELLERFEIVSGTYLKVSVRDSGPGMPDSVRARIFEPFFTTKPLGAGSGMGLTVVYGIVRSHHAAVAVATEPGAGTTFTLYLPLAPEGVFSADVAAHAPPRGRGMVMVVDDEELLRGSVSAALRSLGYEVRQCASGAEAVELYRGAHDQIEVAVIDVTMPGMNGWECLRQLRQVDPGVKAIVTSGYGTDERRGDDHDLVDFLSKPYGIDQLASAVAKHVSDAD